MTKFADTLDWVQIAEEADQERLHPPAKRRADNWIPAGPIAPKQPKVEPLDVVDIGPVWSPTVSPTRDSVSAVDRAKALHVRAIPIYAVSIVVGILALVIYSMGLWAMGRGGAPFMVDRILVFLVAMFGFILFVFLRINDQDYRHSHSGVELARIDAAIEIRRAEIEADLELRRDGLRAYMKMLGVDDAIDQ